MTDGDLRGIVLKKFYELRHQKDLLVLEYIISIAPNEPSRIANICDQLGQARLIEWQTYRRVSGSVDGRGKIRAEGVDVIEGRAHGDYSKIEILSQRAIRDQRALLSAGMPHIFLCHANEDKPQVREVYRRLKTESFEPWLDEEDLLPGQLWEQAIRRALRNSDFILIFFSENSVAKRGYVQREMKLALDAWQEIPEGQIHTIPVRLDACQIPERFKPFQWVDLFAAGGLERLIRAIRAGVTQRQPPSTAP